MVQLCYKKLVPKRVDTEKRRAELAQAVWRLVLRGGVAGASVRAVAEEAGLAMGSVRYFFNSQDELLRFAMTQVIEQAGARVTASEEERMAAVRAGEPLVGIASLLEEVLPLDDARLVEARIYAAFSAAAAVDPAMNELRKLADDGVRQLCESALSAMSELGLLPPDRDPGLEVQSLWALLDGLTMHLLVDPPSVSRDQARSVLAGQLLRMTSA